MPHQSSRRGFTWIELLAIVVVCAIIIGLLFPAILATRENSRRQTCINNLKQIGLAMHSYHDSFKCFPSSASVTGDGPMKAEGTSFLFKSLHFLGGYEQHIYAISPNSAIAISPDRMKDPAPDPFTHPDPAIAKLGNLQIPEFLCPSNTNRTYEDPNNKKVAFTNYKAMGATCMESLKLCLDPDSPPPYGDKEKHPDGAIFPRDKGITIADIADGTSYTIMMAETIDDMKSAWIAGSDVTLVGMPKADYELWKGSSWAPKGYNGEIFEYASPAIRALRTYLAFDFRSDCKNAGTYPAGVGRTPVYGPSSSHAGIVNHLMCDGSAIGVRKDEDYVVYFFAITRDNNDESIINRGGP